MIILSTIFLNYLTIKANPLLKRMSMLAIIKSKRNIYKLTKIPIYYNFQLRVYPANKPKNKLSHFTSRSILSLLNKILFLYKIFKNKKKQHKIIYKLKKQRKL